MECRNCDREIREVEALGGFGEKVTVHVDTWLTVCRAEALTEGGYFDAPHAEP